MFCSHSRGTCTESAEHFTLYSSRLKVQAFSMYRPATNGLRQRWSEIKHPTGDYKTGIQESKSLFPPFAQLLWWLQPLKRKWLNCRKTLSVLLNAAFSCILSYKKCKHRLWCFEMHSWDMQPWVENILLVNNFLTCKLRPVLWMPYGPGQTNSLQTTRKGLWWHQTGWYSAFHSEVYREAAYQVGIRLLRYSSTAAVPFARMAARGVRNGFPSKRSVLRVSQFPSSGGTWRRSLFWRSSVPSCSIFFSCRGSMDPTWLLLSSMVSSASMR